MPCQKKKKKKKKNSEKRKLDDIVENLKHMVGKKAKPSVMADIKNGAGRSKKVDCAGSGETSLSDLKSLIRQISKDIVSSEKKLAARTDTLESDLEGILYARIHELITSKMKSEIDALWREYSSEVEGLNTKVAALEESYAEVVRCNGLSSNNGDTRAQFEECKKRTVVRNLPQGVSETPRIVTDIFNTLIRDCCKN